MSLAVGIVGLPNVGKSTLLNALSHAGAEASNYPFCTIDQNVGVAPVPDPDLARLATLLHPSEVTPTTIRFVDIAGLIAGASKGEGLGNKFLGHIRDVDAVLHVVRCFENERVVHTGGAVDPVRDAGIVETELLLADLEVAERARQKWAHLVRTGTGGKEQEAVYARIVEALSAGRWFAALSLEEAEREVLTETRFLTAKPFLYLANTDERDAQGMGPLAVALRNAKGEDRVLCVSVQIEAEVSELPPDERQDYLSALGLRETALERVIGACYRLLDLITFYTIANDKLRAWQLPRGATAQAAAGRIHSDMARGFIRAEVMGLSELLAHGSRHALLEQGLVHTVGRDYVVRDKDILQIHFKA